MPFVGLVSDPRWEPPDDSGEPERRWNRHWRVPWGVLAWVAVWWTLLLLAPVAATELGDAVGYFVLLFAVALGCWRVDRWFGSQYSRGLRDYQS